ncbi:TetR/AcrR family transcriptional regulator; helix-turn-helix transcriptional regulator [Yinghuangia sp. ASG 101]|uniref:TetR/AcrR family transcriptional regulator n=1 Tax=Yinghuangia sp. ASG 101 TaxID=2896848 RepID=UPI001E5E5D5E|nr:TetR/AcrR family transcriptional regulator [Yinghuangia sp. ASG 101]UGQ12795.1 TetR/AcrR family transcriptional regulator; helix-turn-helix transcriptional regulator [Yinghuangia sp. ASG 101]
MAAERADAARNRAAILRAAEHLLDELGPEHVSLDRVAAAAGVGKGTVFRRFGSRTGLFGELLADRAARIRVGIASGPPPLGPGAPPADRLAAFLDELARLAARNTALMAAQEQACAADRQQDPTYRLWHDHVTSLVAALRPGADARFLAHVLLGAFDSGLVRATIAAGGVDGLRRAVRDVAAAVVGCEGGGS